MARTYRGTIKTGKEFDITINTKDFKLESGMI